MALVVVAGKRSVATLLSLNAGIQFRRLRCDAKGDPGLVFPWVGGVDTLAVELLGGVSLAYRYDTHQIVAGRKAEGCLPAGLVLVFSEPALPDLSGDLC